MAGLTYEQVRSVIQNGDVVFLHGSWKSPTQALVMLLTGSIFSHVCIAFWVKIGETERLMCVEAQGSTRRRILTMSFYDNRTFTVLPCIKRWTDIEDKVLDRVGKAKYNPLEAIYVGIREFVLRVLHIKLPIINLNNEICSEFVASVLELPETEISPQLLYDELSSRVDART